VASAPQKTGTPVGNPGPATTGKPGRGDAAHATWRNRVRPSYPGAARAAGQAGRVLIVVNVNALGRATGARIYKSSGYASLDQAALSAARASTFNPKRIAGLPLPDTITIPYTFRLEDR
jgi:protein TonB